MPGRIHLNGHVTERLPNTLNVSVDRVIGEEVLAATTEIASSTGSACHEGNTEPSDCVTGDGNFARTGAWRVAFDTWTLVEMRKK